MIESLDALLFSFFLTRFSAGAAGVGADFLNQLTELGLGFAFLAVREEAPLSVIDLIKKMHDVPAFGGHQSGRCF